MPVNIRQDVVHASPRTFDERNALANTCVRKLKIELPALLDAFDNSTEAAYTAWPDRMYVIDKDGRIAYKGKAGPYGFRPAEVEETLRRIAGPAPGQPSG